MLVHPAVLGLTSLEISGEPLACLRVLFAKLPQIPSTLSISPGVVNWTTLAPPPCPPAARLVVYFRPAGHTPECGRPVAVPGAPGSIAHPRRRCS